MKRARFTEERCANMRLVRRRPNLARKHGISEENAVFGKQIRRDGRLGGQAVAAA
jgi:hypothetical protein